MGFYTFSKNQKRNEGMGRVKLFFPVLCMAALIFSGILYFSNALSPANPGAEEKVMVNIPKGANSYQIADLLKQEGLVKNANAFVYYLRFTGQDSLLKSGNYSLSPSRAIPEIVDLLVQGTSDTIIFTVPEGYTVEQISSLLQEKGIIESDRFDRLIAEGNFSYPFIDRLEDLPEVSCRLEGYLFPDTYHVGRNITEKKIINIMIKRFWDEMQYLQFPEKAAAMGLSLKEAITIASMVEKEAKVDEERPVIAGIIFNRLERGMLLQIDATVQYVLQGHRSTIYYEDLEVESPYNTYQVSGLPPGPIGAPGRKSLQAVLEPKDTDYLYYVAKPDGSHAFAKTLQGHNANISKYQ